MKVVSASIDVADACVEVVKPYTYFYFQRSFHGSSESFHYGGGSVHGNNSGSLCHGGNRRFHASMEVVEASVAETEYHMEVRVAAPVTLRWK